MSFKDLGLNEHTIHAIEDLGYKEPTTVQKDVIPSVLAGKDIFIIAPSACGKTCSYIFPLIDIISKKQGQNILIITADDKEAVNVSDKLSISERMIGCEKQAVKPFVIIAGAVVAFAIFMLFVPANVVKFTALCMLLALLVTVYTSLIIGPASYVALLDIRDMRNKAILSRNDTVNKEIKKKIKKSKEKAEVFSEPRLLQQKPGVAL